MAAVTSAVVMAHRAGSEQPAGAGVYVGGAASAVAARTLDTWTIMLSVPSMIDSVNVIHKILKLDGVIIILVLTAMTENLTVSNVAFMRFNIT